MKLLIQRVSQATVAVAGETIGAVQAGFLVLVGVRPGDDLEAARLLARRTVALRVFADDQDKMNRSLLDIGGAVLAISQFTLYADTRKGNRPSFMGAAAPELAERLYDEYVTALKALLGPERVATGRFGATMRVSLVNEGPVTIELHTDPA